MKLPDELLTEIIPFVTASVVVFDEQNKKLGVYQTPITWINLQKKLKEDLKQNYEGLRLELADGEISEGIKFEFRDDTEFSGNKWNIVVKSKEEDKAHEGDEAPLPFEDRILLRTESIEEAMMRRHRRELSEALESESESEYATERIRGRTEHIEEATVN